MGAPQAHRRCKPAPGFCWPGAGPGSRRRRRLSSSSFCPANNPRSQFSYFSSWMGRLGLRDMKHFTQVQIVELGSNISRLAAGLEVLYVPVSHRGKTNSLICVPRDCCSPCSAISRKQSRGGECKHH